MTVWQGFNERVILRRNRSRRTSLIRLARVGGALLALRTISLASDSWQEIVRALAIPELAADLGCVLTLTFTIALLFRLGTRAVYLSLVLGELDRRPRQSTWCIESIVALSSILGITTFVLSRDALAISTGVTAIMIVAIFELSSSEVALTSSIQRFTRGFATISCATESTSKKKVSRWLIAILVGGCIPWLASLRHQIQSGIALAIVEATESVSFVVWFPLSPAVCFTLQTLFAGLGLICVSTLFLKLAPLIVDVHTHSFMTRDQGSTAESIRQLLAIQVIVLCCVSLISTPAKSCVASGAAILVITIFVLTNNAERLESHLSSLRRIK